MNQFEMVTLIVVAVMAAGVLKARYRYSSKSDTGIPADLQARSAAQDARIAQLEERVKSLEAVIADPRYELRQQFKDLSANR